MTRRRPTSESEVLAVLAGWPAAAMWARVLAVASLLCMAVAPGSEFDMAKFKETYVRDGTTRCRSRCPAPAGAPQRTPPRAEPLPLHEVLSKDLPLCCAPQALRTHGTIRSTTPSTRCVPFIHRAALSDSLRRDQPSLHREPDRRGWLACWLAGLLAGF